MISEAPKISLLPKYLCLPKYPAKYLPKYL